MRWWAVVLCLMICSMSSVDAQFGRSSGSSNLSVEFFESPSKSMVGTRQFLDAVALRVLLKMGYTARPDLSGQSSLRGQSGVIEVRMFSAPGSGRNPEKVIGLGIVRGVSGGQDLALYAEPDSTGRSSASRDISNIKRQIQQIATTIERGARNREPDIGYEMIRLGHIEAEKAISLLQALGYTTMSLSGTGGRGGQINKNNLPLAINVGKSTKTSLMDVPATRGGSTPRPATGGQRGGISGAPELGGTYLHSTTSGAPEERLLLVYDKNDPESLEKLVNVLQTQIDIGAQQIVIEALVIELNTGTLRDLGVEFKGSQNDAQVSFEKSNTGTDLPFTFFFSRDGFTDFISFKGKLEALAESGKAQVLSSPSVLVLNDRQARIQVGQQVPVVRSTTTASSTSSSVEYFPIGIVLNLRPRISPDGEEVTMQIETIISSISESAGQSAGGGTVAFAPVVDNRTVETFVRVAEGTPFIIGGLLSTEQKNRRVGLPIVSRIPLLGRLVSRETSDQDRREVIVVITPYIVPLDDRSFSYLIPKDTDLFDRFDTHLFRNAYRVRDDDVWDLRFIRESEKLQALVNNVNAHVAMDLTLRRQEPFASILDGRVAGEEVLVRRMMYEIIERKLKFGGDIDADKILYFVPPPDENQGQLFVQKWLHQLLDSALKKKDQVSVLTFGLKKETRDGQVFTVPLCEASTTIAPANEHESLRWNLNEYDEQGLPVQSAITLGTQADVDRLRNVLILKQVLELNAQLPLTLEAFRPGVQLLFPSREDMRSRFHVIDHEVARLFYETTFPYQSSERAFNLMARKVDTLLGAGGK